MKQTVIAVCLVLFLMLVAFGGGYGAAFAAAREQVAQARLVAADAVLSRGDAMNAYQQSLEDRRKAEGALRTAEQRLSDALAQRDACVRAIDEYTNRIAHLERELRTLRQRPDVNVQHDTPRHVAAELDRLEKERARILDETATFENHLSDARRDFNRTPSDHPLKQAHSRRIQEWRIAIDQNKEWVAQIEETIFKLRSGVHIDSETLAAERDRRRR